VGFATPSSVELVETRRDDPRMPRQRHTHASRVTSTSSVRRSTPSTSDGGRHTRTRHGVSTSSTGDRARHTGTSPGLDKLDQRSGATHGHVTGSRQARPAIGRDTRARHRVSTSSTGDGGRHTRTSRGLDKLDQRSGATHGHVTGSRQARPAIGRDTRARHRVSTSSTSDRARHTGTSRGHDDLRARNPPVGRACRDPVRQFRKVRQRHARTSRGLDKLDQRSGATHTHVARARPARGRSTRTGRWPGPRGLRVAAGGGRCDTGATCRIPAITPTDLECETA
jgi:hypothetical protein